MALYRKCVSLIIIIVLIISIWAILPNTQHADLDLLKHEYAKNIILKFTTPTDQSGPVKCERERQCDGVFGDIFQNLIDGYRHCVLERLKNKNASTELEPALDGCLGNALWRLLDVKTLENRDDTKQAIIPPSDIPAMGEFANCTELTLGIGRDIEAELLLRKIQPHCKFHGADPIRSSGDVFRELGEYFEIAVGAYAGTLEANVLEQNEYKKKTVPVVTLVDFLLHYMNTTKVDYVFMDNEGPEYNLFPQLLTNAEIERSGISICQISAEMHMPFHDYGTTEEKYNQLIHKILTNSSFLPIWSTVSSHVRSFYVNVGDPYCVGKYFRSKWCGDFKYFNKENKKE